MVFSRVQDGASLPVSLRPATLSWWQSTAVESGNEHFEKNLRAGKKFS
jgi:hypothetical protein